MNLDLWKKTKRERNMTYQDISERSGIPLGTIKNIFAGYTPDPRESTIIAIEQALGVETRLIHVHHNGASKLPNDEQALLDAFRKLPEDLRHRASVYLQKLVELSMEEKQTIRKKTPKEQNTPRNERV